MNTQTDLGLRELFQLIKQLHDYWKISYGFVLSGNGLNPKSGLLKV